MRGKGMPHFSGEYVFSVSADGVKLMGWSSNGL